MTDEEIVLYFNEHRLAKLESYLLKDGSSVEHELQNLLDRFYEQTLPEHERMEVEAKIELEREREAATREASRRFAVVHFHEGDDDFFFTSELRNSFYSIANLYRSTLKDEIGKYTLESIAQSNFSGCQTINDMTFSVLCNAMPNDPRITALVEFDFDHNTVSVCESSDNAWWTYNLKDTFDELKADEMFSSCKGRYDQLLQARQKDNPGDEGQEGFDRAFKYRRTI